MAYKQTYFEPHMYIRITYIVHVDVMTFRRVNAFGKLLKDYIMLVCVYCILLKHLHAIYTRTQKE